MYRPGKRDGVLLLDCPCSVLQSWRLLRLGLPAQQAGDDLLYGPALWGVAEPFAELASCYGYGDAVCARLGGLRAGGQAPFAAALPASETSA